MEDNEGVAFHGPTFSLDVNAVKLAELLNKLRSLVPTYATWHSLGCDGCECEDMSCFWVGIWVYPDTWTVGFGEDEYAAEDTWEHKTLLGALELMFSQVPEWEKDIARYRQEIKEDEDGA